MRPLTAVSPAISHIYSVYLFFYNDRIPLNITIISNVLLV